MKNGRIFIELFISILKCLVLSILLFVILFVIFFLFGLLVACIPQEKYHYEYLDLDNNSGIAEYSSYKLEKDGRGGQGSPICISYDGTVKQVKEYKRFYDGIVFPIKDMLKRR